MADILKLNFEGIDEATTWTEEAQDLTPTEVYGKCEIDTAQHYDGTSSLRFGYETIIVDPGEFEYEDSQKRIIYTVPNIEAIFEYTIYFRFHDLASTANDFYMSFSDSANPDATLFEAQVYGDGTDLWFYAYGRDSSTSEFDVSGTENTYYDQEITLAADTWHKLYVKVLDRDVVVEINDVEIVTLTASMDDPLLGIDTVNLRANNSGTGNDIWVDKILMSNGISSGSGVVLPTVTTQSPTYVSSSGFTFSGVVVSTGGENISRRGFCYLQGGSGTPTISGSVVYDDGSFEVDSYTKSVSGLLVDTSYMVRAYAENSAGVAYGSSIRITTLSSMGTFSANKVISRVSTDVDNVLGINSQYIKTINKILWRVADVPIVYAYPTNITSSGITIAGDLRDVGLDDSTVRGFCYIVTDGDILPTVNDFVVYETGTFGIGGYSMNITGLDENVSYTVRPFATNGAGTSYGPPIQIQTYDFINAIYFGYMLSGYGQIVKIDPASFEIINTLSSASFTYDEEKSGWKTMIVDAKNGFAYLPNTVSPGVVTKINLYTFERMMAANIGDTYVVGYDDYYVRCGVIDPDRGEYGYLYLCTGLSDHYTIVRMELSIPSRVDSIVIEDGPISSAVIDTVAGFAYFGLDTTAPAKIIKVDLSTFTRVATLEINEAQRLTTGVIDPIGGYAYFGTYDTIPGRIVRIRLSDFSYAGQLHSDYTDFSTSVIDPTHGYAYFASGHGRGYIQRIALSPFSKAGVVEFNASPYEAYVSSSTIDIATQYAYFGTNTDPGYIIKVDLSTFTRVPGRITLGNESYNGTDVFPAGAY